MKLNTLPRFLAAAALGLAPLNAIAPPASACSACGCSAPKPPVAAVEEAGDIVEIAASAGQFGTLLAAADAAGLVEVLQSEGPLTVFAPTDAAFAKLPEGTVEELLKPENKEKLAAILSYHVVPGAVNAQTALALGNAVTAQGGKLAFATEKHDDHDHATVNGVYIMQTDIKASNGMIHVIDAVLIPAE